VSRSAERILIAVAILAASTIVSFRSVYEPDLGWHLAQGRENFSGHIVRTNIFSFTYPDYRQRYTTWLADTSAYVAWRIAGDTGIQTLVAAAVALSLALVYAACRVQSAALPSAAVLVLAFFVLEPRVIPRPHLASFVGFAACSWLIQKAIATRSARPSIWAIPVVAAWSNLHGEAILGVVVLSLFAACELARPSSLTRHEARRALVIAAASAAALLINPYGWGLVQYMYENISVPSVLSIAELRPAYLPVYRAFFAFAALAAMALVSLPRTLTLWEIVVAVLVAALGFRFLRLTPLIALVTAPMVAVRLTAWALRGIDGRAMIAAAVVAAVFVSRMPVTAMVRTVHVGGVHPDVYFPQAALDFMRANGLKGPVFNSHNLGGWLAWTMYPDVRVFQDSRLQAYPSEHFRAILEASRSQPAWNALVSGVDWAVVSLPRPNALSGVGRFPPDTWASIYDDGSVEILVRNSGVYGRLVK
jgi:hypothetical protein